MPDYTITPIALFTYNRPSHTQLVLESLSQCDRLCECELYIYCDGPKSSKCFVDVEESRKVVRKWEATLNAKVVEREKNLGLAHSIVAGVTALCKEYGKVIVLEDDFVVSTDFIDYMLQALDLYKDNGNVYQVSGYMFPLELSIENDAFFLPLTTTWGWATWERAWKIFDWQVTGAIQMLEDKNLRNRFDLDGSYPYYEMLKKKLNKKNNSWGILWWWAVFNVGGLVLHPRQSLVWVGGFDGSGTHCGEDGNIQQELRGVLTNRRLQKMIKWPNKVTVDTQAFCEIKKYLKKQYKPTIGAIVVKVLRRVRNFLK